MQRLPLVLRAALFVPALPVLAQDPHAGWRDFGGAPDSAQYSSLTQITRENAPRLQVAWTYPIGEDRKFFFNPVVVDDLVYVMGRGSSIVALSAATGREVWTYQPPKDTRVITTRGINYWESKDRAHRHLLFASNHALRAIDARTGRLVTSFGDGGSVDLKQGLDRDPASFQLVQSLSPGRVFEDLIILGSATNQGYGSAPGDIRAYHARTGQLVWTFRTIPRPGEPGAETWPPNARQTVGGANVWSEFSVDEKRGILFAPTASAKYNFYGADRVGENLYSDCLLALDARTGKRLWHHQMVRHDIWDYDAPTAPKLLTIRREGRTIDVVAQVTKQGYVWVFERETGTPVWPIEERPAPKSDLPHERVSPTQPFPTNPPPFARTSFTVDDLSPYLGDADREKFRAAILGARNEGMFTPPSRRGTIQMPGNNGGANWGGAAVDPARGTLVVVSKDLPCLLKLDPKAPAPPDGPERYETPFGFMIASDGLAAIKPPWTTLTVYDLNAGMIKWQIPLGDVPHLAAKGIRNTGTHHPKVGPIVTATGLIFTGTRDKKVRVFDLNDGKLLWEHTVEAAIEGIPAMYEIGGRQHIVFCASAQAGLTPATQEPIRGAYVAFALPDKS